MNWQTATPDDILADLRTIVESEPPVYDASQGQWLRWAIEPDGRVVLVVHNGPHPGPPFRAI